MIYQFTHKHLQYETLSSISVNFVYLQSRSPESLRVNVGELWGKSYPK